MITIGFSGPTIEQCDKISEGNYKVPKYVFKKKKTAYLNLIHLHENLKFPKNEDLNNYFLRKGCETIPTLHLDYIGDFFYSIFDGKFSARRTRTVQPHPRCGNV